MIKKQMYEAPKIEVLELRMQGVTCTSPVTPDTASEWEWE